MSVRTFFIGLALCFALAWAFLLIGPYGAMADLRPIPYDADLDGREGTFPNGQRARVASGSRIFLEEGCTQCHTQMLRPETLGNDTFRPLASGDVDEEGNLIVPPRASHPLDYYQMPFAPLGVQRIGPDLSNVGVSRPDRQWHFVHLYAPRAAVDWSIMPSYKHLFEVRPFVGPGNDLALDLPVEFVPTDEDGNPLAIVPTERARVLVDYLLELRHDEPLPVSELSPEGRALRSAASADEEDDES